MSERSAVARPRGQIGQALAVWQWRNYAVSEVPPGHQVLRINLDETSVKLFQGDAKGTVLFRKRRRDRRTEVDEEPVQKADLNKKRTCLTHVGLICDRADVQPLLPQVLIGNEATFQAGELADLSASCPANVVLIRQKSAWNNKETCKRVLRLLAAALRKVNHPPKWPPLQPVLFMDAAGLHIHPSVAMSCAALNIWLIVVPAKLTWLLQPLDTHAFREYKAYFKKAYQRARLETQDGHLTVKQFLVAFCETIRHVLQGRKWSGAFDADGYGHRQAGASAYLLRQLQLSKPPEAPSTAPTSDLLRLCFPKKSYVPEATLMRPYRRPQPQLALQAPAPQLVLPTPAMGRFARGILLTPKRAAPSPQPRPGPVTRLEVALHTP